MYRLLPALALGAVLCTTGCGTESNAVPTAPASQTATAPVAFNFPDLNGKQRLSNQVGALPYTVVLDRQSRIAYTHRSEITLEQAEQVVLPLL